MWNKEEQEIFVYIEPVFSNGCLASLYGSMWKHLLLLLLPINNIKYINKLHTMNLMLTLFQGHSVLSFFFPQN